MHSSGTRNRAHSLSGSGVRHLNLWALKPNAHRYRRPILYEDPHPSALQCVFKGAHFRERCVSLTCPIGASGAKNVQGYFSLRALRCAGVKKFFDGGNHRLSFVNDEGAQRELPCAFDKKFDAEAGL